MFQITNSCRGGMCRPRIASPSNTRTQEAAEAVHTDLALLIGLAVALVVFCCVSLASIRLIRQKGSTSASIYNMSSLPYQGDFMEKVGVLGGKRETKFSFPGARRVLEVAEDKQALQLDFPLSATSSPHPEGRQQATKPPAPALLSPARSEHQYDVPFSHLLPRWDWRQRNMRR